MPALSIIVPTYREAENLPRLCEQVHRIILGDHGIDYELLVVDDQSPDETVDVVEVLSKAYPVRLIQPAGRERDLSRSVIDGFREAAGDNIVVMDADLSHPVDKIPELLEVLQTGEGRLVLGSRYVAGGSFDRAWSFWRYLNSASATWLAAPLTSSRDPMTGFFALRRRDLPDLTALRPIGYKIALELMVRGGFQEIVEVPIGFRDRTIGESKMTLGQQFKYLRHLRRLYLYRYGGFAEFIHYGAVGASGFVVDIAFYYVLQFVGLDHRVARGVAFWPAVSWNWALNRLTTFGDRRRRPRTRQWIEFMLTSGIGFVLNWGVYVTLTSTIGFFDEFRILALVTGIVVASLFNFMAASLFVYSDRRA
ncbi:MAG: glycosyltransferase family 2 protein [Proteobacteria bacterium]|nr:glycosyltransferase family 2 protein [Pseudomonadota bacterium]